jgi:GTPase
LFFDRPESGELAVLIHLNLDNELQPENRREFEELVLSAGGDPVSEISGHRRTPHPRYFVGTGKLEEIREQINLTGAQLVIFNHNISPGQERNIEQALCCRVLDRTGLILDIFAQRAKTHEGKLQVELAQLEYMSTRLVRGWTHLERQKGGIGLRGPGETQLETDRRLLRARIKSIHKRLEKVRRQRHQSRRSRQRAETPTVSLVGYTNAGKSTLFNAMTGADAYAADQLFATLDPTMRAVNMPVAGTVILADTVGFISHLPHKLVEAFRATLEEAANAALLLHIVDASSDELAENIERVEEVLAEIGAAEIPVLKVYNKIDLLENVEPHIDYDASGKTIAVWLSAQTGKGIELLFEAIQPCLDMDVMEISCRLPHQAGRLRAKLYEIGAVVAEHNHSDGATMLDLRIAKNDWQRLLKTEGVTAGQLVVESRSVTETVGKEVKDNLALVS